MYSLTRVNYLLFSNLLLILLAWDVKAVIFQQLPLPPTKNEKTTVDNFLTFVGL